MTQLKIQPSAGLHGQLAVPGDKSISHRIVMLGSLADGPVTVSGFLRARDCLATVRCMRALGVDIEERPGELVVHGRGLRGLRAPEGPLDCGGSGTTMRLLSGLLAGQGWPCTLAGNAQLSRRPMARVAEPLRLMGARVELGEGGRPPITLGRGALGCGALRGIDYALPVASAQVKSAVLLAGLFAQGRTRVREPGPSRDHTERMLRALGVPVETRGNTVALQAVERLVSPGHYDVPGDMSSAAFLIVAAAIVPGSDVTVRAVGRNGTRTGMLDALASMGADLQLGDTGAAGDEPRADVRVRSSSLVGSSVGGALVPRMIDEFPVFAVAATQAQGISEVRDAAELRVKESDRISALVGELRKLGARIEAREDGFIVEGPTRLRGAPVSSHGDHRLAMALIVAGLVAEGETVVDDVDCIADSFPGFVDLLRGL